MIALLSDPKLNSLAERIIGLKPCPMAGEITVDQIKIILAEHGILPASVAGLEAD